jgi:hypothetical protein
MGAFGSHGFLRLVVCVTRLCNPTKVKRTVAYTSQRAMTWPSDKVSMMTRRFAKKRNE